jgi:hypothetical protein
MGYGIVGGESRGFWTEVKNIYALSGVTTLSGNEGEKRSRRV